MKDKINLDKVALIGRRFKEYYKIFRLSDFNSNYIKILDVGSGVSSFCAEAQKFGMNVTAIDPIYEYDAHQLEEKCAKDLDLVIKELNGVEHLYIWNIFKTKEDLKDQRKEAYKIFIHHYKNNRKKFYISETLPKTSFENKQFDVIISSHLLFLYDHLFDYSFHEDAIKEMLRIASREIRLFPLVNLYGKSSRRLDGILEYLDLNDIEWFIEKVDYEFIRGGNEMMRIIKNSV
ncbi:MAG: hypothetical protein ACFFBP_01200 [Promethearchaeota archaeon]